MHARCCLCIIITLMTDSTSLGKRAFLSSGSASSVKRRYKNSQFGAISQREFAKRIRFRDTNGYTYAVPHQSDNIFVKYVSSGVVRLHGKLEGNPEAEAPLDTDKVVLYLRKPRTKNLVPIPQGKITLLDMETQSVYEARVSLVITSQMDKPGHIILEQLVNTGRVGKSADFSSTTH